MAGINATDGEKLTWGDMAPEDYMNPSVNDVNKLLFEQEMKFMERLSKQEEKFNKQEEKFNKLLFLIEKIVDNEYLSSRTNISKISVSSEPSLPSTPTEEDVPSTMSLPSTSTEEVVQSVQSEPSTTSVSSEPSTTSVSSEPSVPSVPSVPSEPSKVKAGVSYSSILKRNGDQSISGKLPKHIPVNKTKITNKVNEVNEIDEVDDNEERYPYNYKTVSCSYFNTSHGCRYGDECTFIHSEYTNIKSTKTMLRCRVKGCLSKFPSSDHLSGHVYAKHTEKEFKDMELDLPQHHCDKCRKAFTSDEMKEMHMEKRHNSVLNSSKKFHLQNIHNK